MNLTPLAIYCVNYQGFLSEILVGEIVVKSPNEGCVSSAWRRTRSPTAPSSVPSPGAASGPSRVVAKSAMLIAWRNQFGSIRFGSGVFLRQFRNKLMEHESSICVYIYICITHVCISRYLYLSLSICIHHIYIYK